VVVRGSREVGVVVVRRVVVVCRRVFDSVRIDVEGGVGVLGVDWPVGYVGGPGGLDFCSVRRRQLRARRDLPVMLLGRKPVMGPYYIPTVMSIHRESSNMARTTEEWVQSSSFACA
jgi:hypothetical protein